MGVGVGVFVGVEVEVDVGIGVVVNSGYKGLQADKQKVVIRSIL